MDNESKREHWEEKKNLLLNMFLEITEDTFLTVPDVKEIMQVGYEFFKQKHLTRSNENG